LCLYSRRGLGLSTQGAVKQIAIKMQTPST
jgi:hypothetical protein